MAIKTVSHRGLLRLLDQDDARGIPTQYAKKLRRVLTALQAASVVGDMALYPGWRLHPLKGDRAGFWSITITGNLRLVFRFENGDAFDLNLVDYH